MSTPTYNNIETVAASELLVGDIIFKKPGEPRQIKFINELRKSGQRSIWAHPLWQPMFVTPGVWNVLTTDEVQRAVV